MIARVIAWSARSVFLVLVATAFVAAAGVWACTEPAKGRSTRAARARRPRAGKRGKADAPGSDCTGVPRRGRPPGRDGEAAAARSADYLG